ncbi:MAG TPA: hypothetical protein DDZ51_09635 [Planctomycetaceae bacterium]|nr:hypothetical protein [Planctomycetaceae bacterium]
MAFKINVGLSRKIGQPNFGSLGASCHIDLEIDPQTIGHGPEAIQSQILGAFAICKQAVDTELAKCDQSTSVIVPQSFTPSTNGPLAQSHAAEPPARKAATESAAPPRRPATPAQIKAIHAIAGKAGIEVASELGQRYGIRNPQQLSIGQASEMIDHLKQSLTPTPA